MQGIEGPSSYHNFYPYRSEDERNAEERAIDDWIPINSSKSNEKWWFSSFHHITAIVGAGVLNFPYAMHKLKWYGGIPVLVMSWSITLYTMWQMVEMHEMVPGKRFDRYHELGQYAFGDRAGLWIVIPQQLIAEVGVDIVYMITGGTSLKKIHDLARGDSCSDSSPIYFIMIFSSVHFVLSQLPNFNAISGVSLVAAVMSLSYCTITWAASFNQGTPHPCKSSCKTNGVDDSLFAVFSALGSVVFAYAGHSVVMEIQSTMPSTPESPSKRPMLKGVIAAYIVVALCYFPVGLIAYGATLDEVDIDENILISLHKPKWLIAMANMFIVIHLVGSYQIYAMPVYDMIEVVLVKKLRFKPSWRLRFFARNTYVAFTVFMAITFPFFGALLGFFGGFAFTPTTYYLPCIIWLIITKPRKFSLSWFINWICIIVGVALTGIATVGGLRMVLLDIERNCYKFYS